MKKSLLSRTPVSVLGLLVLFTALLLPMTLGAQQPEQMIPETFFDNTGSESESEPESETGSEEDEVDIPAVSLGEIEPGLERAGDLLEESFSHFLYREELGFDAGLIDLLVDDALYVYDEAEKLLLDPTLLKPSHFMGLAIILIIIALFTVLFLLIDRQVMGAAHHLQARTHFDISIWMTIWVRKAILVLGRSVAVVALIALSFFPVRATFGAVNWTLLLTDILVILLIYRFIKTGLLSVLRLHPHNEQVQQHARQIERFSMVMLRISFGFLVLLAAIARFEYHDQMLAFASFAFRLSVAVIPIYLVLTRDAVLSLLPDRSSSRLYRALYGALSRNYYLVLGITVILLLFNAAGYEGASVFLLTRGYALLAIGIIWFTLLERLQHYVQLRFNQAQQSDDLPSPLPNDLERWLMVIGSLTIAAIALRILALYEPLLAILKIPLVSVGHLQISLFNLLNVVVIIVVTTYSIRLFKSLLNAKVYPAFGVDIGVAYAVNTLINYAVVVVAFILCLVALGVHLSAVMVVMASLGVGIGFGLQNIAENLISGFILLFGRAVKKGDFITVNDLYGRVEAVGARSVVMRTPDNYSMLVPSKEIVSGRIINWTFQDSIVRIHIPIGVSYDSDPGEVRQVLLDAAKRHPDVLPEPAPDVWIVEFNDSSIQFELLIYFDCRTTNERTLKGKLNFILWEEIQNSDVEVPFPQRDLHLRTVGDASALSESLKGSNSAGKKDKKRDRDTEEV